MPHPRIEALLRKYDGDKSKVVAELVGKGNAEDLTAAQLKAIGFGDQFIRNHTGDNTTPYRGGFADDFYRQVDPSYPGYTGGTNTPSRPPGRPGDNKGGKGDQKPGGDQTPTPTPPGGPLEPPKTSAFEEFKNYLLGLGMPWGADIEAIIRSAVIDGITPDRISLILPDIQNTATWNTRFPGWKKRVANGYNQLSVADYLNLENTYHRILQSAGLPAGFYDSPGDFGEWIANDVSPQEIQGRVDLAMNAVRQVDPTARDLLTKFYGLTSGDLASYFLDQSRALPTLDRQYKAVNVAKYAAKNGLKVFDANYYEDLVDQGVTADQASQGYSVAKTLTDTFGQLGDIYGLDYSQRDAEEDVFFNRSDKRRKLAAAERASFSGSSSGATGRVNRGTSY